MTGHETLFRIGLVCAAVGLALIVFGRFANAGSCILLGQALTVPLLILAALAIVIGLPLGLWTRWRETRK